MAAIVYISSLRHLLAVLAYCALSGIIVYGLQRATFAVVSYLMLAFGVVGSLVSVALNTFAPSLTRHLVSGIADRIMVGMAYGGPLVLPVVEYAIYILAALALSLVSFHKKEMEF